jgi:hypothetical protein
MKMHEGQIDVDAGLVRDLLVDQLPDLADLRIVAVHSTGTVNALFRLGEGFVVRLPLLAKWSDGIEIEWEWIPRLARHVSSVRLPDPIFLGRPAGAYPFAWSVYRWIDGEPYEDALVDDEPGAAETLAAFVTELRSFEAVASAPKGGRRPLVDLDEETRAAIRACEGSIDSAAAMVVWEQALAAPAWNGERVWIHGDLLRRTCWSTAVASRPSSTSEASASAIRQPIWCPPGASSDRSAAGCSARCSTRTKRPGRAVAGSPFTRPRTSSRTTPRRTPASSPSRSERSSRSSMTSRGRNACSRWPASGDPMTSPSSSPSICQSC